MNFFKKYNELKSKFIFEYKGYPVNKILAINIAEISYDKARLHIFDFIKMFRFRNVAIPEFDSGKVVFSIGAYKRPDYYQVLDYVKRGIDSHTIDLSKTSFKYSLSLKNIIYAFNKVFRCTSQSELTIFDKLFLFLELTQLINTIDHLENITIDNDKIISFCSFCSNLAGEAELNYFFKKNGVITYTIQHGLWFIYPEPQPIDAIVYENLLADKLLCWGQYTQDEFSNFGIDSNSIAIAGYPRDHTLSFANTNIEPTNKILVLFARNTYSHNNKKIIEIIKKLKGDYLFEYKLHPSLDVSEYKSLLSDVSCNVAEKKTLSELIQTNNYLCTITYNSTAYYDSYVNACPSLRFIDDDWDNSISVMDDSFNDANELQDLLNTIINKKNNSNYWHCVKQRLTYILGFNINRYELFLKASND